MLINMPMETKKSMLTIDEPENNLHPAWQKVIGNWIQTSENYEQCFISTHSPDFLDVFTEEFKHGNVDGRFHNKTEEEIYKYRADIVKKVRDILENQEIKVFLLFASPEAESWFVADWEHGFKALYESNSINDLEYSERQFFVHQLKQYIDGLYSCD